MPGKFFRRVRFTSLVTGKLQFVAVKSLQAILHRAHGIYSTVHNHYKLINILFSLDNEIEDILSFDEAVLTDVFQWWVPPLRRIPPLLWIRIRSELAPYLVERGLEGGAPVLTWYHRQFTETATEVIQLVKILALSILYF